MTSSSGSVWTAENMELQIIPKQSASPDFDHEAIRIQYIEYCTADGADGIIEGGAITEEIVSGLLGQIPTGISMYLSLLPQCGDNWMEVISDGTWLALGYSSEGGQSNYYSYNPDFKGTEELSPLLSEGQSVIEKYLALTDMKAGQQAVEYFIRTGRLSPNIDWAKQI